MTFLSLVSSREQENDLWLLVSRLWNDIFQIFRMCISKRRDVRLLSTEGNESESDVVASVEVSPEFASVLWCTAIQIYKVRETKKTLKKEKSNKGGIFWYTYVLMWMNFDSV